MANGLKNPSAAATAQASTLRVALLFVHIRLFIGEWLTRAYLRF